MALENESGLLALAGDADMRRLFLRAAEGEEHATLAIDVYLHSLVAGVPAMTAAMGGLDVLVLTRGVGENAAEVRAKSAERLAFLGVQIDGERNRTATADADADADVSLVGGKVRTLVVAAREDLEIERGVLAVLGP